MPVELKNPDPVTVTVAPEAPEAGCTERTVGDAPGAPAA